MKRSEFLLSLGVLPATFLLPKITEKEGTLKPVSPRYGEVAWRHPKREEFQRTCPVGSCHFKDGWCFSLGKECSKVGDPKMFKQCDTYLGYCTGFAMAEGERWKDFRRRQREMLEADK